MARERSRKREAFLLAVLELAQLSHHFTPMTKGCVPADKESREHTGSYNHILYFLTGEAKYRQRSEVEDKRER